MRGIHTYCISLLLLAVGTVVDAGAQDRDKQRSFQFADVSLRTALDSLMRWYPVSIVYLDDDVEDKRAYASCSGCSFEEALDRMLEGTSLAWTRIGSQVILKPVPVAVKRAALTLWGNVADSVTGEWIPDAIVIARREDDGASQPLPHWCPTNQFGFFSLRNLSPGAYSVSVRAVGYKAVVTSVVIGPSGPALRDITLVPEAITLQEVTVEAYRSAMASAGSYSRGVYIRSGPSDQNQYFLDGARIYNPSHFGGVLSSISEEAVNEVQQMVGGTPPSYGGRIGGILDLSMRDGSMERLSGSAGTGSLGSRLSLEGPLGSSASSFLVSARRAYPDALVPFLKDDGIPSRLGSSEATAKLSHRLSSSSRLFLNGYWSSDAYQNQVEGAGMRLNNNFGWSNGMANLRWIGIVSPSLFLQSSASYSRYGFTLEHALADAPLFLSGTTFSSDYAVEDLTLRAQGEQYYDEQHTVLGGVELIHHRMHGDLSTFSSQIAPMAIGGSSTWELSVYLQDQWRIIPGVMAEIGARATSFSGQGGSLSGVDPRFALLFSLNEKTRLVASVTSINQFLHPYRNSGVFLFYPSVFWYPSTDEVRPSTSLQVRLGVHHTLGDGAYVLSGESFYRLTRNLHEFMADTALGQTSDLRDFVHFGTGKTAGIEAALQKRLGVLTGSLGYMYAWEQSVFADLNGGRPFVPRFSRRHEIRLDASLDAGETLAIGALCVIALSQSWSPVSPVAPASTSVDRNNFGSGVASSQALDIFDLSQNRFPGFQRLELSVVRRFHLPGASGEVSLRMLNAYGLLDPFAWSLHVRHDPRLKWTAEVGELKLFPLYPALGVAVRF
jgi:hypothetical protein